MAYLTSLNELKTYLRIPSAETSRDVLLQLIITETSDDCEQFCSRAFTKQAYSGETHQGGGTRIVLNNYPVDLTQAFQVTDFDGQISTVRDPADYVVDADTGVVTLLGGLTFSDEPNGAQFNYNAGYAVASVGTSDEKVGVPSSLSRAVRDVAAGRFKEQIGAIARKDLDAIEASARAVWAHFRSI